MLPNFFDWDQMSIATSRQNVKIISEEKQEMKFWNITGSNTKGKKSVKLKG